MSIIQVALTNFLSNDPTISAYVTTAPFPARIYPLVLRQDNLVLPAITYHMVAGNSGLAIDGNRIHKAFKRIQLSAWANDRVMCDNIVEALRVLLNGYIGLMNDIYVSVVAFDYGPTIFDHVSKVSHSPCQISLYHDET
jgi:hypothetical protein